jgi:hypothetical protein
VYDFERGGFNVIFRNSSEVLDSLCGFFPGQDPDDAFWYLTGVLLTFF